MSRFPRNLLSSAALGTGLAVALTVTPAGSPAQAASPAEIKAAKATNVYVQGDSLTVGTERPLRAALGGDVRRISVDAQVGRFTATGMSRLRHSREAKQARVWVIALGTNDGPDPDRIERYVRQSLRWAGPNRQVVWATIVRPGGYQRVNRMLRRLDDEFTNLHIVPWSQAAKADPGLIGGDRVHGTARGYTVRARMIRDVTLPLAQSTD